MSIATLRPNGTLGNSGSVTGASAHAALSDDSAATYIDYATSSHLSQLSLGTFSIPAGAVAKSASVRLRQRYTSPSLTWVVQLYDPTQLNPEGTGLLIYLRAVSPATNALTTVSSVNALRSFTQAEIDSMAMTIERDSGPGNGQAHEAYVDLVYVTQPVVTVTAPTGTVTNTNRPTVTWTNTLDSDGRSQTHYEIKVFSDAQYGAGGFDPATSIATYGTGVVTSAAMGRQLGAGLADGTYRAYVRVAQTVNNAQHWSAWDFEGFVVDVDRPAAPVMTLTAQSATARIAIALEEQAGAATTDDYELERASPGYRSNLVANPRAAVNTAGWETTSSYFVNTSTMERYTYATPTIETDDGFITNYFTVGCSGASINQGRVIKLLDAMDIGQRYRAWVYLHRENSAAGLELVLGDAVNGQNTAAAVTATTIWERYAVSHVATNTGPLYLAIRQPTATARIFSFTLVLVAEVDDDTSQPYGDGDEPGWHWVGAEHASVSEFGEWLPVRNNTSDSAIILAADATIPHVAVRDYEAPNGVPARYRARSLHDYSGAYASSGWVKGSATWQSTQWWLKHPNLPAYNVPVEIASYREVTRAARQTAFQPMGSSLAVVVSDATRGGATGTVVLQAYNQDEQDALNALLDTTDTLLLQGPVEDGMPDRYVRIGDHGSSRVIDKSFVHITGETLPWTLVARPGGAMSGEYVAATEDDGEELVLV